MCGMHDDVHEKTSKEVLGQGFAPGSRVPSSTAVSAMGRVQSSAQMSEMGRTDASDEMRSSEEEVVDGPRTQVKLSFPTPGKLQGVLSGSKPVMEVQNIWFGYNWEPGKKYTL